MLLFRWHVGGPGSPTGTPGCCKAPMQETWSSMDPTVPRELRGPVSTKGLESSAKRSERRLLGAGHLGGIGAGAALRRLSSPHSNLSALTWDWERKSIASCGLNVTVRGVRSGLRLFYFAPCWYVIMLSFYNAPVL